ncbi:MAG: NAD-binding protein [Candidatus Margulisiibacteriota bacterium]
MNPLRRLFIPGLILIAIVVMGVVGYTSIEGWSVIDALYMVVITLSTVGFREVHDLSSWGRVLTMGIIVTGVSTAIYAAGQLIEMMVEGQIIGYRRRKKMKQRIKEIKDHYIICGFGRVGHQVAAEFTAAKIPFVVIDSKAETAVEMEPKDLPYIIGDIAADAILEEAGIMRAKGLVASADSDTANVFVTLSARVLNPNLYIIARSSSLDVEEKLRKAGADRVISPYFIGGKRMAQLAIKPTAVDFLDTVLHSEHLEMEIREIKVNHCHLAGKTLAESQIRQKSGAYVAAIRNSDGEFNLQPTAESKIESGDTLVVIGAPKQFALLERCLD